MKKKKKKKKTPFDLEGALNEGGADEGTQDNRDTPEPAKDDNDDIDLENFGKKKKKKKKVIDDEEEKGDEEKDASKEDGENYFRSNTVLLMYLIIHMHVVNT